MIWIIGAGGIAREYAKEATGVSAFIGGLDKFLEDKPVLPEAVIVATVEKSHVPNCVALMKYGVKRIFCEKPGFLYPYELDKAANVCKECGAEIYYAYNRRFFASTLAAEKVIEEDGGLLSFNFEFTEWGHVIATYGFPKETLDNWFYANSTHVIDLAFFLGGKPVEMTCFAKDEINWHKPSNFAGAGITDKGALFNYQANWNAPGRWAVELLTSKHRIILKPMEQLQLQDKGSVKIYPVEIDNHLDVDFKPGFYLETKAFLEGNISRLCTLQQQREHLENIYKKMVKR